MKRNVCALIAVCLMAFASFAEADFVFVEGGTFSMGNANAYGGSDEKPVHSVTLTSFYICNHEVTQTEYKAVMGTNPSSCSGDNKPVDSVCWYDAIEYCNKRSVKEGKKPCYSLNGTTDTNKWGTKGDKWDKVVCDFNADGYRLPTEAEWEYAARGGKKSQGYNYSGSTSVYSGSWNFDNSDGSSHDIKGKVANELGLYDMSGNVAEWCWDQYGEYSAQSQTDPTGVSSGFGRIHRGGSWSQPSELSSVYYRGAYYPYEGEDNNGLRVVSRSVSDNQIAQSVSSVYGTYGGKEYVEEGFVYAKGGVFSMGNDSSYRNSTLSHNVTLSSFYICDHEVTQDEYKAVMGRNPSNFSGGYKPVENVTWYDAVEYCNRLSIIAGLTPCYSVYGETDPDKWGTKQKTYHDKNYSLVVEQGDWDNMECDFTADGYRLPTEAEWEYAARGGSYLNSYTYSGSNSLSAVAWYKDTSTHDVKSKDPNGLGLYDMSGNVREWCWDWYGSYAPDAVTNPKGPVTGAVKITRGGDWGSSLASDVSHCQIAVRRTEDHSISDSGNGFRLVRSSEEFALAEAQANNDFDVSSGWHNKSSFTWYDSTAVVDTSVRKLGNYTLTWNKNYVTFSERENGRDVIKACYNHCFQYWEYQAGKDGYTAGISSFKEYSVDLNKLYKRIDGNIQLSRFAPAANSLKPLLAKRTYSGKKCSVGDIVLQDGTTVNPTSYKEDSRNPAIGVIAFFKDENYTGSSDVGSQRGNVEDAVILGIKRDIKPLIVPEKKATFYRDDNDSSDDMLSYIPIYDVLQDRQEHSLIFGGKYYENSYIDDGANNYAIIKAAIDETVATNPDFKQFGKISYPAFEVAENYGVTNNIKGTFRTGWFIPTDKESSFLEGNKTTINYALSKIKGADTFATSEYYVAEVRDGVEYLGERMMWNSTPFGSDNNFLTSNTGRRFYDFVWNAGLVYCIRNYADIDAAYSGRPVNAIASGTYGEKPQANAVGDIVFSDGSSTALRSNLILTKEQKKAVMAVGVYIGDGYIGEDGYLYVASVYRKNSVSIINDELGQIKNAEKVPSIPVNEYNTLILQYGSLPETPHFYPFTGTINDGNKIWETIKNAYSWATGEKDRSGNYIKGFLPFIYADSYGSGNMFIYEIKKGSAYNPDAWNIAATKQYGSYAVTTPKLGSNYSSGWFIPSYAENAMALSSIGKFRELFRVITESDVGSCYSNRSLYFSFLSSGLQLHDTWETMSPDVVFHKAPKVYNEDLSLSPTEFSSERCYIGDVVLMDGSFVRNELYEPNPKNPAVGIVAFFKDKDGSNSQNLTKVFETSEGFVFTGSKEDAVILGIKSFNGTWQEANAFASNYGTNNSITGIYKKGWYMPSADDTLMLIEAILSRCLSKVGYAVGNAETGSFDNMYRSFRIWTSTENADGIVFGYDDNNARKKAYTWNKDEVHVARVLHDYAEPVTFVAAEEPVTNRYNPYKVGDIVLQDGSVVSASSYKANSKNPAVGVIAFFKDSKFPNSGDYGSRTGTKENAYIIGLQQKRGVVPWASSGAQGLSMQKELQTYPSMMGLGAANTAMFYPGSDNDGSDNWQKLCAAVSDENRTGRYPAFEFAASYGKTAGITGSYSGGWYVPTLAELTYVYRNKRLINESIELIDMQMCIGGALYITSSQLSFEGEGTYVMNGYNGNIELEGKNNLNFGGHGVLVIRPLSTAAKTPEQWKEPVVQNKTAENPVLKPSPGTLIGKKPYPDAVGDIIFSDGSATAFTNNLYLTKKEKKEAVAVAAFIGDGKIGEKGKIYGLSLSSSGKCGYYDSSSRFLNISSWCTGFGKNMIWSASEIFDGPRINGCYPNGKIIGENEDQYYKVSYFTGDVDGSDNWDALCKTDPYGALNAESIYPAWNFVKNLGDGWYLASTAELWMIDKNRVLINNARLATGYEAFDGSWSSSFTGNEAYPACTAGNGGFGDHQYGTYYEDEAYGLYAFDMGRNIFGNAAY